MVIPRLAWSGRSLVCMIPAWGPGAHPVLTVQRPSSMGYRKVKGDARDTNISLLWKTFIDRLIGFLESVQEQKGATLQYKSAPKTHEGRPWGRKEEEEKERYSFRFSTDPAHLPTRLLTSIRNWNDPKTKKRPTKLVEAKMGMF